MRTTVVTALIVCGTALTSSPLIHSGIAIANSAWVVGSRHDLAPDFTFERSLPMPERIVLPTLGGAMVAIGIGLGVCWRRPSTAKGSLG